MLRKPPLVHQNKADAIAVKRTASGGRSSSTLCVADNPRISISVVTLVPRITMLHHAYESLYSAYSTTQPMHACSIDHTLHLIPFSPSWRTDHAISFD